MEELFIKIYIFVVGLFFGSFYDVVGMRLPNNESIIKPGSHCPKCNHKLKWYENIPVLSYIFLKGKCKECKSNISAWYPAIEILTGLLFLISYYVYGISYEFLTSIVVSSLVVIIFVSDSKYMIINDSPLLVSSIFVLIIRFISGGYISVLKSLGSGLLIFAIMYGIMLLGNIIFKRESLGGGDIKLSFFSGLVLGPLLGVGYIVLSAFLAFPYAVYVTIKNSDSMLPFGPFLATSLLVIYLNYDFAIKFIETLLHLS